MADQMKKQFVSDELFPPVPAAYHERMEEVLASLPEERTVGLSLTRKQILILAAALLVLLAAGTALAVGISRMQEVRDSSQTVVSAYQAIVKNESSDIPVSDGTDVAVPTPYVTLKKYETDDNGNVVWEEYQDEIRAKTNCADGYCNVIREYDSEGRLISERYTDRYNQLANNAEGVASWNGYYDEEGNLVITNRYDKDLKPVEIP